MTSIDMSFISDTNCDGVPLSGKTTTLAPGATGGGVAVGAAVGVGVGVGVGATVGVGVGAVVGSAVGVGSAPVVGSEVGVGVGSGACGGTA